MIPWWLVVLSFFITSLGIIHGQREISDYCHNEVFHPQCSVDEVLVIKHARLGRMRLGRCVRTDYGHVGCSADVLPFLDRRCSGKRKCSVHVSDTELVNSHHTCPEDFRVYLEVQYDCVTVLTRPAEMTCLEPMRVNKSSGYILSDGAPRAGCDMRGATWKLTVAPGQTLNFTLWDFSGDIQDRLSQFIIFNEGNNYLKHHFQSSDHRSSHVYTSQGHEVEIEISVSDPAAKLLLQFEALGCPGVKITKGFSYKRQGNYAILKCESESLTWHIVCHNNQWLGLPDTEECEVKDNHQLNNGGHLITALSPMLMILFGLYHL